ncbi:hypothetical protein RND81_14G126700 [Saponaria officinalis]|uniref:Uncharacterized protein n=1 Tax=Saponaria officinalis TaxID=3572 RepID=A0AAW1GP74_SAPOF
MACRKKGKNLRCENDGWVSENLSACLEDKIVFGRKKNLVNIKKKCTNWGRIGTIKLTPIPSFEGLTPDRCENNNFIDLIGFDCEGLVPTEEDFAFGAQWRVETTFGRTFENVELTSGKWMASEIQASISNITVQFRR